MRYRRIVIGIIIIVIAWILPLAIISQDNYSVATATISDAPIPDFNTDFLVAADDGKVIDWSPIVVLEMPGYSIPARGSTWLHLLQEEGIPAHVVTTTELIADPTIIHAAPVILVDGSLGADSGSHVPAAFVDLLVGEDASMILTGRSAWLLHLLRERGPPSGVAPSTAQLLTTPGLEGAIYLSSPIPLTLGSLLTTETGISLPNDVVQTEMSRLVDLTGAQASSLASLRYDSWPLETFLLGPEDPQFLTVEGRGLVVNTIAYAAALRENSASLALAGAQASGDEILSGGYTYAHEATMAGTYYAVRMAEALMDASEWLSWKSTKQGLILSILNDLIVHFGAETGFLTAKTDGSVGCKSTAQGLWVASVMGLSSQFAISEIVNYLSSRQDVDGGFENHITITYHVIEALAASGFLGSIDTGDVESWLRSCVIDGGKTSDPDLWGSIASNPTSTSPTNQYASDFVKALEILGTTHNDPAKLTSWIITRTGIGDGSYRNTVGPTGEITIGTGSALTTMAVMGTLNQENKTSGLSWLISNQLDSGGFGLKTKDADIVAKSKESCLVAGALNEMSEISGLIAAGLKNYLVAIETDLGFELMDPLPSLMWNYWLAKASRMNHATGVANTKLQAQYLDLFTQWTQYPWWNNITAVIAPEYGANQYRTKSVWTQYFGVGTALSLGVSPSSLVVADALNYISMSQYVTGHFRPAMFIGTAHIQHSVAAVEALYLMGSLAAIPYRSALETAMLADYNGEQWSMTGWTIEPYVGQQAAIDWLCTRAALRLDIADATMAAQISSSIISRIQYSDLYALSCDVATLALLNSSGFSVDLESIDRVQVLNALGPTPFPNGWLNTTDQWQPVFTAASLEMVAILGLRPLLYDTQGSSIFASTDATVSLGSSIDIDVIVSSSISSHTVLIYAFGDWIRFTNVTDSDVLTVDVPSDLMALGPAGIYTIVVDWSHSRAYGISLVEVRGNLEGVLAVDTPIVTGGSFINGSVSWVITPGIHAGTTNITVRLGDSPTYQQWSYQDESPFELHVPSADFSTGNYNLTVTLERQYCDTLILHDTVDIATPVHTYLLSPSLIPGTVGHQSYIDWSLHYSSNGTEIASQQTTITIVNGLDQVVHTAQGISLDGGSAFYWTPNQGGNFSYAISFVGNGSLVGCNSSGQIYVYEGTVLTWLTTGTMNQYCEVSLEARLETSSGTPLVGHAVHVTVTSPSSFTLIDTDLITNSTGHVSVLVSLNENGAYDIDAVFEATGDLRASMNSDVINAWSESTLVVGGISDDNQVGSIWQIWGRLEDSISSPVVGESMALRIILLPSTVVAEYTLVTNSTGHVKTSWLGDSAGAYRLEAEFAGIEFRGLAYNSSDFCLWVPVTLTLVIAQTSVVGVQSLIEVTAEDHFGLPVDGLYVTVTVRDPQDFIQIQQSGTTAGGILQITWTPLFRGQNSISAFSVQQTWYDSSSVLQTEDVFEEPRIDVLMPSNQEAPSIVSVTVSMSDYLGEGISGASARTIIAINGQLLLDVTNTTPGDGRITHLVSVSEPGILSASVIVSSQGWLLAASSSSSEVIMGATGIDLTTPGHPIEQGTSVGIVVTLTDLSGAPLDGAQVIIEVLWSNGTIETSVQRVTGADGKCTLAYDFDSVGDFIINASYTGEALNSSATASALQRVYMTPTMQISHNPSCMLGETLEIYIGITDTFQDYIIGRGLILSVEQNSITVFATEVESIDGLLTIYWDPVDRGMATITLLHAGDSYYYTNFTGSPVSILELVGASLIIEPSTVNLFNTASLRYTLLTSGTQSGVIIHFEVLGLDLVPVWTANLATNETGVAEVFYFADDSSGILTVRASPIAEQYLIGGDTQEQLNVMTICTVTVALAPNPPRAGHDVNITLYLIDQLGFPIENLDVVVSLNDPLSEPVRLGVWSNSITVTTSHGVAIVSFVPSMSGLYSVHLSFSGAAFVHSFTDDTYHTVYSQSSVNIGVSETQLEVGDVLGITVLLTDYQGSPMVGRDVIVALDGPGVLTLGPTTVVTDGNGQAFLSIQIDDEGLWVVEATFEGLGVYLSASDSVDVSVRYGTEIQASIIPTGDVVAGLTPASISFLLMDSGGTPLEGFTIEYSAYHDLLGFMMTDSVIQIGHESVILNITFDRMGNYTILLSFTGTLHYHASNAALRVWVYGTTSISFSLSSSIERSSISYLNASIIDESGSKIALNELSTSMDLLGPDGIVNLTGRYLLSAYEISISLEGIEVGSYRLSLIVLESSLRIGSANEAPFDVYASTTILVIEENLSGIIHEDHGLTFILVDSIGDIAEGATVYVSLYTPDGREIHGSPLTTRTAYSIKSSGIAISWIPSIPGNYTLLLIFESSDYWLSASAERVVLVRYPTVIQIEHPVFMEYGEPIPLSITVSSGVFKIQEAPLMLRVWRGNILMLEQTAITGIRGGAEITLEGLLAGNLSIEVEFGGLGNFAPITNLVTMIVTPVLLLELTSETQIHVGSNCNLNVNYTVLGVDEVWIGGMEVSIYDPMNQVVYTWNLTAQHRGVEVLKIIVELQGEYRIYIAFKSLPAVNQMSSTLTFQATSVSFQIPMDAETVPLAGGLGLVALAAILVRKRVGAIVGNLPGEWES